MGGHFCKVRVSKYRPGVQWGYWPEDPEQQTGAFGLWEKKTLLCGVED